MILLDTNLIIYYLHRIEPYASKAKEILIEHEALAITLRILDEALFTIIRLEAWRRHGIKRIEELREYILEHGLEKFQDAIRDIESLINKLGILVLEDKGSFKEIVDTMISYNLLPGDALIAVTARYYGITTIATFDQDFKRIPWLRTIP